MKPTSVISPIIRPRFISIRYSDASTTTPLNQASYVFDTDAVVRWITVSASFWTSGALSNVGAFLVLNASNNSSIFSTVTTNVLWADELFIPAGVVPFTKGASLQIDTKDMLVRSGSTLSLFSYGSNAANSNWSQVMASIAFTNADEFIK